MKPLIVGICGIKRSFSTGQYNLIRISLELAGYDVTVYGHDYIPAGNLRNGEAHLIKRHPFDKIIAENADYIFLTDRDGGEILQSLERFEGDDVDPVRIQDMKEHLAKWKPYSHLCLNYSFWNNNPLAYTGAIMGGLDLGVDPKDVLEQFNKIRPPKEGKDPKTLLFHNHITR